MKKYYFTVLYLVFVIVILLTNWHEKLFDFTQPLAWGKGLVVLLLLVFSALTIYYSTQEDFFKSLKKITVYRWGRQIGLDLWVGQILSLLVIYWFTGSFLSVFLWFFPFLAFGNLATLLYFFIHYDTLVEHFLH